MQVINDPKSSMGNVLNMNNIYKDLHGELLNYYFKDCVFTKPLIAAFDKWLEVLLPNFLKRGYSFRNGSRVWIENLRISRKNLSNGKTRFPHYCRLNDETYDIRIEGDFFFKSAAGNITSTVSENGSKVTIADIPLMVGSKHCSINTIKADKWELTREAFKSHGEDPDDPMGYFIINGTERIVLCQEKLRLNTVLNIIIGNEKNDVKSKDIVSESVSILCCKRTFNTQYNTKLFELQEGKNKALRVFLNFFSVKENKKKLRFPALLLFRHESLGQSIDSVVSMILTFIQFSKHNLVRSYLINSVIKYELHADLYKYYHSHVFKDGSVYENVKDKVKNNFDYLFAQDFFPQCPNKAEMYCFVIARYVECTLGIRKPDDRDTWACKRIEWGPRSMESLFISMWNLMMKGESIGLEKYVSNPNTTAKTIASNYKQSFISDVFRTSFTSAKWGKKKTVERMTEALERKSLPHVYSQLTKVNVSTTGQAQFSIRIVQGDQWGFICPSETAEGEMCGVTKHLASTVQMSQEHDMSQVHESIMLYLGDLFSPVKSSMYDNPFFINGNLLSWCKGDTARTELVRLRRQQKLPVDVSVILESYDFRYPDKHNPGAALFLYCDAGRPIRPLLVYDINPDVFPVNRNLVLQESNITDLRWSNLLQQGAAEFIDCHEGNYILLATSFTEIRTLKEHYEIVSADLKTKQKNKSTDPMELHNIQKAKIIAENRLRFTHAELDPASMFGYAASTVPMPNRIQGPRVGWTAAAGRQAMNNLMHIMHEHRFDTTIKSSHLTVGPNFKTNMMDTIKGTSGRTLFVAFMPYMGYNQEDSIIINKEINDNLYFSYTKYSTKTVEINVNSASGIEKLGIPKEKLAGLHYRNLSVNGIIKVGSVISQNDVLVAKSTTSQDVNKKEVVRETSITAGMDDLGIVDKILSYSEKNSNRSTIKIKIRKYYPRLEVGNKLTMRYSQKGIVGLILPPERMPVVVGGPLNGRICDVLINPHAIPSRMTTTLLIEMLTGKYSSMTGEKINATAFREFDIEEFKRKLGQLGMNMNGTERMMNPETGEIYKTPINAGFVYYMSLTHVVSEKLQARGTPVGKNDPITGQPLGGRSRGGGIRAGEMEGWSFISHGAISFALDRSMISSDDYQAAMCQKCSSIVHPRPTGSGIEFICKNNCNALVGRIRMPFSMKRFSDMVRVAGINMVYKPILKAHKVNKEEVEVLEEEEVEEDVEAVEDQGDEDFEDYL